MRQNQFKIIFNYLKGTIQMIKLEEVFKRSGVPTHTFVEPLEYKSLLVSIRTPGRATIIEGPSGIGKTTCVNKIINSLQGEFSNTPLILSGRKNKDLATINNLPSQDNIGLVIIDDFHRLSEDIKNQLADYIKILADEEDENNKIIIIGINKAGQSLLNYAIDLTGRIDTISFEANPIEKIQDLIELGERALNISINIKDEIAQDAEGSFHLAQMLCHEACIEAGILEKSETFKHTTLSMETIRQRVLKELDKTFFERAKLFATGPRLRRAGRTPYLRLLKWLSETKDWTLNVYDCMRENPEHKNSIGQIVDKNYLNNFLLEKIELQDVLHFEQTTGVLAIEDPKFFYYIKNILWSKFAEKVGYKAFEYDKTYDFALSFAGENRDVAELLYEKLSELEFSVFYDLNEQHRILSSNVEDYLAPIYSSEATYIIVLLGPEYPVKIWTKFESEQFKSRFGENAIIPIWFSDARPSIFDTTRQYGGMTLDTSKDFDKQVEKIVDTLYKKIEEKKYGLN